MDVVDVASSTSMVMSNSYFVLLLHSSFVVCLLKTHVSKRILKNGDEDQAAIFSSFNAEFCILSHSDYQQSTTVGVPLDLESAVAKRRS